MADQFLCRTFVREMAMIQNPIIQGFNPDPSIVRVGKDYFCTTSTFEYFPGAAIYHSLDLIKWELIGHALTRKSQLDVKTVEPGGGVWAATLRYHDGYFYLTTAVFDRYRPQADDRVWPRGFYVKTNNIWDSSSWSDPIYFDQPGFDQDLFWDDDGTVYLSTTYRKVDRLPTSKLKDFAIHICSIDLETGDSTSQPTMVRESASGVSEGSHIIKRGRYYYLFTAEGGTESGHCEWVMRSDQGPLGPYELGPQNPLWRNGVEDEIQNTGHCDLVEDEKGQWWAVSLGVRPLRHDGSFHTSVFGRESLLLPVVWQDDWPIFNNGEALRLQLEVPDGYLLDPPTAWRDDFASPDMQLGWYRKNTPIKVDFALKGTPQHLELYGGPWNLSVPAAPTVFLRKQSARRTRWSTQLKFQPTSGRTEAGTVVWWNYLTYSSIGVRRAADGSRIIRFKPAEGAEKIFGLETGDADVLLVVDCQDLYYRLGFQEVKDGSSDGVGEIAWAGSVSTDIMTRDPSVGAAFTGMMLGLYAFGEMERCLVPAVFKFAAFE